MKQLHAALGAVLFALATGAAAQTWPAKPITFLNPFPAGGGTDTFARPIAARVSQTIGQQVIVENQGGAGGTVGATSAAKRAPDGYNWFFGAVHHTIAESLYTRLPYGLEKDFEPITVAAFVPKRGELVVEDELAVIEQPADEGRFAIVDAAAGQEAQEALARLLGQPSLEFGLGCRFKHCGGGHQK